MVRRHITNLLESIFPSYVVHSAENGEAALKILARERIDIIVSDWNMPRMSGEELLFEIRQNKAYCRIPFIMMTANDSRDFLVTAIQLGVTQYIVKPFTVNELEEKIRSSISLINRRREKRYTLPGHVAGIKIEDKKFQGQIIDLSRTGAAFSVQEYDQAFTLYKTCTLEINLTGNIRLKEPSTIIKGLTGRIVRLEARDTFNPTSLEFQAALYFPPHQMSSQVESKLNKLIKLLASRAPECICND